MDSLIRGGLRLIVRSSLFRHRKLYPLPPRSTQWCLSSKTAKVRHQDKGLFLRTRDNSGPGWSGGAERPLGSRSGSVIVLNR